MVKSAKSRELPKRIPEVDFRRSFYRYPKVLQNISEACWNGHVGFFDSKFARAGHSCIIDASLSLFTIRKAIGLREIMNISQFLIVSRLGFLKASYY